MTPTQAHKLTIGTLLVWTADRTRGKVIDRQLNVNAVYWFKVEWADGQVCQYTTGRVSDLEYMQVADEIS